MYMKIENIREIVQNTKKKLREWSEVTRGVWKLW